MTWYMMQEGQSKEIPEEVLIYKIQNGEISQEIFVTNEEIENWVPLKDTQLYKQHARTDDLCRSVGPETYTKTMPKKPKVNGSVVWGIMLMVVIFVSIMYSALETKSNSDGGDAELKDSTYNSHSNCMFIGYADPNRPLNGKSHCSPTPKYGYRAVYVDRSDIYNTYHFH